MGNPLCTMQRASLIYFAVSIAQICSAVELPHPGNPTANPASIVTLGSARFTILTPALIRLEWGNSLSANSQSTIVWNRNLSVPLFNVSWLQSDGSITRSASTAQASAGAAGVTISTDSLVVTYSSDGSQPFSDSNLRIQLLRPSFTSVTSGGQPGVWTPSMHPDFDAGNLGGTFHTLDTVGGWPGLNCTLLDPLHNQGDTIPFYPCVPGLVSKSGWSVLDDSRSPWMTQDWIAPRMDGVCNANATRAACVPGQWNLQDEQSCISAGCCWDYSPPTPVLLNLYYSNTAGSLHGQQL